MIVPMKRVYVIVQKKDVPSALDVLRAESVMHLEHEPAPATARITELREHIGGVERVIAVLELVKNMPEQIELDDWDRKTREILGMLELIDQYKEGTARRSALISQWEAWGHFEPDDIEELEKKGFYLQLVSVPAAEIDSAPDGVILQEIFKQEGMVRCVAISRKKTELPWPNLGLPLVSLNETKEVMERNQNRMLRCQERIKEASRYHDSFLGKLAELKNELAFKEAALGVGDAESLAILKGFCPAEDVSDLEEVARTQNWGFVVEDPAEGEPVPTLMRNPKWVELIKPVFKMINILPGYREMDISFFFLLFFSIFFGILIGDAGYGLVFAVITAAVHLTTGRNVKDKGAFFLLYVLSACTVAWGVLTGTFFGQSWLPEGTFRPLVPWLSNTDNVQKLCFLIGAIHLSIAHVWRTLLLMPRISFLAQFGWLLIIWSMYFIANMLILGTPLPQFGMMLLWAGMALIVFFTKPNKNPLKAVGPGLGDLALNIINSFTDVVSYIRLFAVGLATVAVADAVNEMALGLGFSSAGAGVGAAMILIIGHVFNIILGGMAILVHGLRLNVLEFSGHLSMEWSGFEYNPFKKLSQKQ